MNWPSSYKIIGDGLIANIALPVEEAGIIQLNRDPRKFDRKADCYEGVVTEVGAQCKLCKPGDKIVFTRWVYSQSDVDDERIALREVDLVVVNNRCVNNFVAVKIYEPPKKTDLIVPETREVKRNFWGQVIDMDVNSKTPPDTLEVKEGDIILFQRMEDYQYRVGVHTVVFRNDYDVIIAKMENSN